MTERQAQLAAQMEQAQFEAQLAEQSGIEILRQQAAFTRQNSLGLAAERGEIQASNYLRQIRRANGAMAANRPPLWHDPDEESKARNVPRRPR